MYYWIKTSLIKDISIIDLTRKAEIFNNTCSDLPTTVTKKPHESMSIIRFTSDDILKIIKNLYPNKTHNHDMISILMLKVCDPSLCEPLESMFTPCL